MRIKEWVAENLAFLITLVFGAVVFYATFQNVVYRMAQVEARVEEFEELTIPRTEFNILKDQVIRIEGKIDRLLEK